MSISNKLLFPPVPDHEGGVMRQGVGQNRNCQSETMRQGCKFGLLPGEMGCQGVASGPESPVFRRSAFWQKKTGGESSVTKPQVILSFSPQSMSSAFLRAWNRPRLHYVWAGDRPFMFWL